MLANNAMADADPATIRVALHTITVKRVDGAPEDDFKTWAQVLLLPASGVPDNATWYACGEDAALARTSVTNGGDAAAYNYARVSRGIALTEDAVTELVAASLLVRARRFSHPAAHQPPILF